MATVAPVPNVMPRPGWPTGPIVDPAYAKLGSLLSPWTELEGGDFVILGVPFEGLTINEIGGKGGPDGLRRSLARLRSYSLELDLDITDVARFADLGDVEVEYMDYETTFERTEAAYSSVLERDWVPLAVGGSHSVSEPMIRTFARHHGAPVGAVWLDAHPDLMDSYKGDRHYCGCTLRRLLDDGALEPSQVALIGLRGFANAGGEIREGIKRGMRFIHMEEVVERGIAEVAKDAIEIATSKSDHFYLSFDTDVLDHAYAPGTQYPSPGGLQGHDAMRLVRQLALGGCGAMDIVEYAPLLDQDGRTGNLLANIAAEFMAGHAAQRTQAG